MLEKEDKDKNESVNSSLSRSVVANYIYKGHRIVVLRIDDFYASYVDVKQAERSGIGDDDGCHVVNPRWFSPWVDYCNNYIVLDDCETKLQGLFVGHSYRGQRELDLEEVVFDTELAAERVIKIGL